MHSYHEGAKQRSLVICADNSAHRKGMAVRSADLSAGDREVVEEVSVGCLPCRTSWAVGRCCADMRVFC